MKAETVARGGAEQNIWKRRIGVIILPALAVLTAPLFLNVPTSASQNAQLKPIEQLGARLFFDTNLSKNRTQSCATCHNPEYAFIDPRESAAGRAVSMGDEAGAMGDRNTPTLMYSHMTPPLTKHENGKITGGLFWDGRADNLQEQAKGPMLNPVEMNMPDGASVAERIRENADYAVLFKQLFGDDVFSDPEKVFDAAAQALAAYQSTAEFSPFDSKYDRVLRGEEKFTSLEDFGRQVFLTWNCQLCHRPIRSGGDLSTELFTSFEYHNIGLPVNPKARELSGKGSDYVDTGLNSGTHVTDPAQAGKFKVATLRNVAVTGPYMHNGVFDKLRTSIEFYNKYTSLQPSAQINPETGKPWGDAEVPENLSTFQLKTGLALSDYRIKALEAFLRTLTDKRYEHLMPEMGQ
ncbi:cytochrome-c peroxidase [Hyphomicrobium sulfonivorans]|nr:cytochrome c peroxidase [Hyphomicrobium sulfonivorans]